MDIAFVLYDELTALDLVGPYEALAGHPSVRPRFVAERVGPVRADNGLTLHADTPFDELPRPDVIVVPGSSRFRESLTNTALVSWLRAASPAAAWTTSVCTGSLLLAEAGLLAGRPAVTHWAARDLLAGYGVEVRAERVVRDGQVITASGVSAGIDMGLTLAGLLWGEEVARVVQLILEYEPRPPFDSGSPERAAPETLAAATAVLG